MERVKKVKIRKYLQNSKKIEELSKSKRGKHCLWNDAAMISAIQAVKSRFLPF